MKSWRVNGQVGFYELPEQRAAGIFMFFGGGEDIKEKREKLINGRYS